MRYIHHYILKTQQHGRGDSLEPRILASDFFLAKPNVVKRHCFLDEEIINQQTGDFSSLKNVSSVVAFKKLNGIRVTVGCSSEHYAVDLRRPDQAKTVNAAFAQTS
jgi:hypothetical protein